MAKEPIPDRQQEATFTRDIKRQAAGLDGKVDKNDPIVPGTYTKITYDAKGLVVAGAMAVWDDLTGEVTVIPFDTTPEPTDDTAGFLRWNELSFCLEYVTGLGNIVQVGRETWDVAVNKTGATATDGKVVYLSGVVGGSYKPEFMYADARDGAKCSLVGVVTASILNNEQGPVTVFGVVNGMDTSVWAEGDKLYVAADATGTLTNTAPLGPNFRIWVATVLRTHPTDGIIFVSPRLDFEDGVTLNSLCVNTVATFGDIAGGDYTETEADGTLKFNGNATVWRDIDFPIIIRNTGVGRPVMTTIAGNITAPQWAVNDYNQCEGQEFVHSWKEGSTVYWHVHVITNGIDATDRYVRFTIEALWGNSGATILPVNFDAEFLIPANTPDRTMILGVLPSWTPTGGQIGAHVWPYLKRVSSVGVAPSGDPFCTMLQLHIECDTAGSRTIGNK
jgi:hypothetical protein